MRLNLAGHEPSGIREDKPPSHQPWGLGILPCDSGPAAGGNQHPGMIQVNSPTHFDREGIGTIIVVVDPDRDAAIVFLTTDTPKPGAKAASLNSGVLAKVL